MTTPADTARTLLTIVDHSDLTEAALRFSLPPEHLSEIARAYLAQSSPPPPPVGMEEIEAAVDAYDAAEYVFAEEFLKQRLGERTEYPAVEHAACAAARASLLGAASTALAARDERIAALEALVSLPHCDHTKPCTCGSGGHPRKCNRHPNAYRHHVAELNAIGSVEAGEAVARLTEAIEETMVARERIAALETGLREARDQAYLTGWTRGRHHAGPMVDEEHDDHAEQCSRAAEADLAEYVRALADAAAGKVGA